MADFTGMTVRVTLKPPTNLQLVGKVGQVVPGQFLTLQNVYFPHNGGRCERYVIQGPTIADLQVVDPSTIPSQGPTGPLSPQIRRYPTPPAQRPTLQSSAAPAAPAPLPIRSISSQQQRQPSDFVDPAIVSYGRSPAPAATPTKPPEPSTPVKSMLAKAAESLPSNTSPFIGEAGKSSGQRKDTPSRNVTQQARPSIAVQTQAPNGEADGTQEASQVENGTKKKARRSQKKKPEKSGSQDPPPVMNVEVTRNGNDMNGSMRRGKGWRQTPLLQPSPQGGSPQSQGKVKRSRRENEESANQNGWATEDANDIQDLGDFDFEANHRLFDKKEIFDQLRQGDTTADEDRLVSSNKVSRPGTHGGKNLHPTENVLSPKLGPKYNSNEMDSTSDADTELNHANGRSSSRHSGSRVSLKKQPSRQNSAQVETKPHPLSASMSSARSVTGSQSSKLGRPVPAIATSPMPARTRSPISSLSAKTQTPSIQLSQISEPHFAIKYTLTPCPVLLPTALETLETETISRYGLTQDAITENAARAIAETSMSMFDTSSRRPSRANTLRGSFTSQAPADQTTQQPVVVIIAGNHSIGARAIAAARHLVSRKTKIIIAEATYESPDTQDAQMKAQLAILKRMVKSGASIKRGPWKRASNYIKNLSGPPAVIIDALLAGSTYDSLLETSSNAQFAENAQKEAREMIDWANRSRAPVLSVGCPSGVSGVDGSAPLFEGEPLAIRPDRILALGAPMQGLLDAVKNGEKWDVALSDVGINIALRSEEAVAFGGAWVTELRFLADEVLGQGREQ